MIIQARGLRKRFRVRTRTPGRFGAVRDVVMPRRRQITAVDDIELEVDRGEVIAFIGPNGAGKSTTIKLLTGILHRDAGSISVLGMDPQRHRRRLAYRIATVFGQKSQLWFHLPPIDTFKLLADVYDLEPRRARERIASLTEIFGIGRHLTTPVRKLSLGERIRCEIAASLIHDPELLLLDEPTIGLDVVIRQRIRDLITEINRERGVTVCLTSHDTGDIEKVCRRAVVINHGRIVWDGAVGELRGSLLATKIMDLKLYGLGLFAFTQPLTAPSIGLFLLFTVLAAGVFTAVRVLYHSLTFLLGNAEDLAGVGSEQIITFLLYPGSIFDGPLMMVVLHTLIPAALVAHLPAELFRAAVGGATFDWPLLAAIIAGDAALIAAAWALFYLGLRRYESGNRIGARI